MSSRSAFGASVHPEPLLVTPESVSLVFEVGIGDRSQGHQSVLGIGEMGKEFPSADPLKSPSALSFLTRCTEETGYRIPEVAFEIIVGPGQPRNVVAMEEAGSIALGHGPKMAAESIHRGGNIGQIPEGFETVVERLGHSFTGDGAVGGLVKDLSDLAQPLFSLAEVMCLFGKSRKDGFEARSDDDQPRFGSMGEEQLDRCEEVLELSV